MYTSQIVNNKFMLIGLSAVAAGGILATAPTLAYATSTVPLTYPVTYPSQPSDPSTPLTYPVTYYTPPVSGGNGSDSSNSNGNTGNGGSNNSNNGGNSGPTSCSNEQPKSAPKLLNVFISGKNQVTLVWEKAKDPVTNYVVAFGTKPGDMAYGNPNVGGRDATSYTVKSLSGGQTYYFRVRAGNGCAPGPFSNEVGIKPNGAKILSIPQGFGKAVYGTAIKAQIQNGKPVFSIQPVSKQSSNAWSNITSFFHHFFK